MSPSPASFLACGRENYTITPKPKKIVSLYVKISKKPQKLGSCAFPGKTVPVLWSRLAANDHDNTEQLGLSFSLG